MLRKTRGVWGVVGMILFLSGIWGWVFFRYVPPQSAYYPWGCVALACFGIWLLVRKGALWSSLLVVLFILLALVTAIFLLNPEKHLSTGLLHAPATISVMPEVARDAQPTVALVKKELKVAPEWKKKPFQSVQYLYLPENVEAHVFASGLSSPRFMAFSKDGTLFVSLPRKGQVVALPDEDKNGIADKKVVFARNLDLPHGLAFIDGQLYVAENGRISILVDKDGDLRAENVQTWSEDLPAGGGHWTRSLVYGPDGFVYVSAGSSCNVCREKDPRRAAIMQFGSKGGKGKIYAEGLRNSVGMAFHPGTGELWASDNGRDLLGDDLPPEEINRISGKGHYGWPNCYGQKVPDPDYGSSTFCQGTIGPEVEMQAHSAPLGIAFGFELRFPDELRNLLYVAFHGSWNRSVPTGYKLVGIPFRNGSPSGPPVDVVRGWYTGKSAWGRPVDPVPGPDGSLYLSDDRAGAIYRFVYANSLSPSSVQ